MCNICKILPRNLNSHRGLVNWVVCALTVWRPRRVGGCGRDCPSRSGPQPSSGSSTTSAEESWKSCKNHAPEKIEITIEINWWSSPSAHMRLTVIWEPLTFWSLIILSNALNKRSILFNLRTSHKIWHKQTGPAQNGQPHQAIVPNFLTRPQIKESQPPIECTGTKWAPKG